MSDTSHGHYPWRYWLFLFGAIVFEVAGTCVMKLAQNGVMLTPQSGYVLMLLMIGVSYFLLSLSTQRLPVGVAFAFWEGLGLTFITLVSVLTLHEPLTPGRVAALCAVLGGAMLIHHGTSDDGEQKPASAPAVAETQGASGTPGAGGVSC